MTRPTGSGGFFALPGLGDQGKRFQYNSLNTYLLAALVCRRSGRTLSDYLDERIFRPLGIADHFWGNKSRGHRKGRLGPLSLAGESGQAGAAGAPGRPLAGGGSSCPRHFSPGPPPPRSPRRRSWATTTTAGSSGWAGRSGASFSTACWGKTSWARDSGVILVSTPETTRTSSRAGTSTWPGTISPASSPPPAGTPAVPGCCKRPWQPWPPRRAVSPAGARQSPSWAAGLWPTTPRRGPPRPGPRCWCKPWRTPIPTGWRPSPSAARPRRRSFSTRSATPYTGCGWGWRPRSGR